mgnify:FL=1
MKSKTFKLILGILIIIFVGIIIGYFIFNKNNNLIKLDYKDIVNKIDNKESFVLCVSRTTCSHCQSYKPKLQKVANKYNIKIYYTDIDTYNKDELNDFNSRITFDGGTPVTLFIKNGEEKTTATRIEGDVSTDKIIDKLKKNVFID